MNQNSFWGALQFNMDGSTNKPMYGTQIRLNAGSHGIYPVVVPTEYASVTDDGVTFTLNYETTFSEVYTAVDRTGNEALNASDCDDSDDSTLTTVVILVALVFVLQFCFMGFLVYREFQGKPLFGFTRLGESDYGNTGGTEMGKRTLE